MSNLSFTAKKEGNLYKIRLQSHISNLIWWMEYLISFNFKYWKMNEKWINEKWIRKNEFFIRRNGTFEPIGNSAHTTEYLALGNALLAGLYLKVTVCTTNLISAIYKKSHTLNERNLLKFSNFGGFPGPWKLTFSEHWINFYLHFWFLDVGYIFLLDGHIHKFEALLRTVKNWEKHFFATKLPFFH